MNTEVTIGLKRAAVLCILKSKENGKILLLKRGKDPHCGKYIPVGGKLEPFESPLEAAKREVFEETGCRVPNFKLVGIMTETSPIKFNWINYIYVAEVTEFTPPACNEGELVWKEKSEILDLPTPETDWFIYKYVTEEKKFVFSAQYDSNLSLTELVEDFEQLSLLKNEH